MKIIGPIDSSHRFSLDQVEMVQSVLRQGKIIVYPTDTLYGLGADASSSEAVDRLYKLKSRSNSPVSVLLPSVHELLNMATGLSSAAIMLIQTFMPGALTVICRSHYGFAPRLISPRGSVGFRVPGDIISRQIPALYEQAITTTSVNPAGLIPAASRAEVEAYYGDQVDLMIDIGPLQRSKGSTVIDLTSAPFKILREGEISRQALQDFLN